MDKPDKIWASPVMDDPEHGVFWEVGYWDGSEIDGDATYLLATPERELASELAGTLWQWLELAERTMEDHVLRFDANRAEDFWQGIRETKAVLAKLEGKG